MIKTTLPHRWNPLFFFTFAFSLLIAISTGLSANFLNPLRWQSKAIYGSLFLFTILSAIIVPGWAYFKRSKVEKASPLYSAGLHILSFTFILFALILLIEIFFRICPLYDATAVNPGNIYFSYKRPYNRFGHLEYEIPLHHGADKYRVLVIGDSFTQGVGIDFYKTFSAIAEQQLNTQYQLIDPKGIVQIYNLGHSGSNTEEEIDLITRDSLLLTPDLVILAYVINDAELHPDPLFAEASPPWLKWKEINQFFLTRLKSYAYYRFFIQSSALIDSRNLYSMQHDKNYEGWKRVEKSLARYSHFLKGAEVDTLNLLFPIFTPREYPQNFKKIHEQVTSAFAEESLPIIDLLPFFEKQKGSLKNFRYSLHDSHPNEKAHFLVGKLLSEEIKKKRSFQNFIKRRFSSLKERRKASTNLPGRKYRKKIKEALNSIQKKEYLAAHKILDQVIDNQEKTLFPPKREVISAWTANEYNQYIRENNNNKILWIDGSCHEAYLLKARLHILDNNDDKALYYIEKALSISPFSSLAHSLKGNILEKKNKYPEYLYSYERAYKLSMAYKSQRFNTINALENIGKAYLKSGHREHARIAYDELLKIKKGPRQ